MFFPRFSPDILPRSPCDKCSVSGEHLSCDATDTSDMKPGANLYLFPVIIPPLWHHPLVNVITVISAASHECQRLSGLLIGPLPGILASDWLVSPHLSDW